MGEYVKNKKDMKFQSQDALKTVQSVIDDADKALHDKSRKMKDSPIGEAVAGAVGVGVGAGIGFAALYRRCCAQTALRNQPRSAGGRSRERAYIRLCSAM